MEQEKDKFLLHIEKTRGPVIADLFRKGKEAKIAAYKAQVAAEIAAQTLIDSNETV